MNGLMALQWLATWYAQLAGKWIGALMLIACHVLSLPRKVR